MFAFKQFYNYKEKFIVPKSSNVSKSILSAFKNPFENSLIFVWNPNNLHWVTSLQFRIEFNEINYLLLEPWQILQSRVLGARLYPSHRVYFNRADLETRDWFNRFYWRFIALDNDTVVK